MRVLATAIGAAILASCTDKAAADKTEQPNAPAPSIKPIDGYADIKFGSSFNQAMIANGERFDPYYIRYCYKNLPINGCTLMTGRDAAPFEMKEGIPYGLNITINKFDKLTDVQLKYDRQKGINGEECRSIYERTLDWLTHDYGKFYAPSFDHTAKSFQTKAGNSYLATNPDKEGNWIAQFARTFAGTPSPSVLKQPIVKWDDRPYVMLFATYVLQHCEVEANFSDRQSVLRPDPGRALTLINDELEESSHSDQDTASSSEQIEEYPESYAGE